MALWACLQVSGHERRVRAARDAVCVSGSCCCCPTLLTVPIAGLLAFCLCFRGWIACQNDVGCPLELVTGITTKQCSLAVPVLVHFTAIAHLPGHLGDLPPCAHHLHHTPGRTGKCHHPDGQLSHAPSPSTTLRASRGPL